MLGPPRPLLHAKFCKHPSAQNTLPYSLSILRGYGPAYIRHQDLPDQKKRTLRGHKVGAENWALLSSIVATCKLNDINPVAYIAETLTAILNGHPQSAIEDLTPWSFRKASSPTP
jgi:transposase